MKLYRLPGRSRLAGFTLAEVLITIMVVAVLLTVYTTMLTGSFFLRRSQYNTQAANFIQEEIDTLRVLPYAELLTRTNGNFLGVALQRGAWKVVDDGGRRLALTTAAPALGDETGLALVPGNYRDDFTFSAQIKVPTAAASGGSAGIAFRYRDAENHYRFRFSYTTPTGLALDKVYHGVATTVWSSAKAFSKDTWYTLQVSAAGNIITVTQGATTTTYTDASNPLLTGDLALISRSGAIASYDDVSVTENAATTVWNFNADALNLLPKAWQRLSYADLTGGTGTLTIEDYLGETSMKKATVTISWSDAGKTRHATGSTLIGSN
ncbi:MAG: prepilin-type N-terminal cleavage/methylation domain-containing protein [Patescibacteria group bacterium]|jgi:prepilin-type N-terminal cleavage/methylation domain-containing protein